MHICFYKHISGIAFYKKIKYVCVNEFDGLSLHPGILRKNSFSSKEKTGQQHISLNLSFPFLGYWKCNPSFCFCLACLHFPSEIFTHCFVLFSLIKLPSFVFIKCGTFFSSQRQYFTQGITRLSSLYFTVSRHFSLVFMVLLLLGIIGAAADGCIVIGANPVGSLLCTEDCFSLLWSSQQFNKLELLY